MHKISQTIDMFNHLLGKLMGILLWVMTFLMLAIVLLRYLFNVGSIALQESLIYMHAFIFIGAVGYTLKEDAHVRVDVFYRKFSDCQQAWVNILGCLLFLMPMSIATFYFSWDYVMISWSRLEASGESGGLTILYILKTLLLIFPTILFFSGLSELLKSMKKIGLKNI